jgi:hypothetical protein
MHAALVARSVDGERTLGGMELPVEDELADLDESEVGDDHRCERGEERRRQRLEAQGVRDR